MTAPYMGTRAHFNWASPFGMDPSTASLALTYFASSDIEGICFSQSLKSFAIQSIWAKERQVGPRTGLFYNKYAPYFRGIQKYR